MYYFVFIFTIDLGKTEKKPIYIAAILATVAETATLGNKSGATVINRIILIGCRA